MKQLLWLASLALIAALTAAFQLDQQSRRNAGLAEYVPGFARYYAQPHIVAMTAQEGDDRAALTVAKRLVVRRPVPAENLRFLAQIHLARGDVETGMTAIQHAARRGWRDRATQEAMAEIAVFSGAPDEAANRLAALIARYDDSAAVAAFTEASLSQPSGRERMASILAAQARWEARFLRQASEHAEPGTLNAVLLSAHKQGATFSCEPLRRIANAQSGLVGEESPLTPLIERNCR